MQIWKLWRKGHGCGSTWLSGCRKKGEVSAKTTKKCIFQCFCGTLILPEEYETLPLQVNLFQKLSFLNHLTQNMTRIEFPEKYKFTTCCVQKLFVFVLTFKAIVVHNMLWTCIFQGIQWTISCHIEGASMVLVQW